MGFAKGLYEPRALEATKTTLKLVTACGLRGDIDMM
jgi:hypothetical protein